MYTHHIVARGVAAGPPEKALAAVAPASSTSLQAPSSSSTALVPASDDGRRAPENSSPHRLRELYRSHPASGFQDFFKIAGFLQEHKAEY